MKVLLINHFPLEGSGSGTYTKNIALHLRKRGHEVCVIFPENRPVLMLPGIRMFPVMFSAGKASWSSLPFNFPCFTTHPQSRTTFADLSSGELAQYLTLFSSVLRQAVREFQPDVIVGVGGDNAMSAAKALLALYGDPDLDLAAAVENPALIPACAKAKLVLIATNFSSGSQNSPFAILKGEKGQTIVLKSIYLLPEISVTDADFTAGLTAEQVRTCGLKILSRAVRAYLDPDCTEFTAGMLTEAIAAVLKYTEQAMNGSPFAREKLHNAAALAGASYGNVVDAITPDLPYFPTEEEIVVSDNDVRCAELAECLGFDGCRAFFSACQSV